MILLLGLRMAFASNVEIEKYEKSCGGVAMCFFPTMPNAGALNNKAFLVGAVGGLCPDGAHPITNARNDIGEMLGKCKVQGNIQGKCLCIDAGKLTGAITFGTIYPLTGPESNLCNDVPVNDAGRMDV